ncbi:MAG: aldo/keto reductase [Isosphaeraceae bacterium]|nr:aldo/keto reductase [Isosphaeraceae bacterium]
MRERTLGPGGLSVSAIGLGCWGMSGSYGHADETEAVATLHHALDIGVNFFDTADSYGEGHNELLVGRLLKARRREVVLATKTGLVKRAGPEGKTLLGVDGTPRHIRSACEASLVRLGTDVIDLYYLHRADPRVPIEESVGTLAELVAGGKVRFIGLSEVSAETLRRAHRTHPVAALQSEYSLWTRDVEATALPVCEELGIGFVAFSPLGRGFLTGTLLARGQIGPDDWRVTNARFAAENWDRNTTLLGALKEIAQTRVCTCAQAALAWALSRGDRVVPIPGTTCRRHLDDNVAAVNVALNPDELSRLDAAFPPGAAAGARYAPEQARWLGR